MNARSVKWLALAVVVMFGILIALNQSKLDSSVSSRTEPLFPDLQDRLNDINAITVTDIDGTISVRRDDEKGRWIVPAKDGYPANTADLRQLMIALADALKLEEKTSNPELYGRLGLADPREAEDAEASGVLVTAEGDDAVTSLIIGDTAQREFRYVRIPGQPESWLIDQNPTLPGDTGDWLLPQIVDVQSADIRSVRIRHEDGELIRIHKESREQAKFEVENIPEGRELSYPTVANSIGSVLSDLNLEDVKAATAENRRPDATATFTTFDDLQIELNVFNEPSGKDQSNGEEHWITVRATALASGETEQDSEGLGGTEADAADGTAAQEAQAAAAQAASINERVEGWIYRIPGYKATQLTRRWKDILDDPKEEE